jgi:heme A synthase
MAANSCQEVSNKPYNKRSSMPQAESGAPAFARYAWGVLAYNLAVIVWGAYVRATGSGAGCGNHWPLCNGEITPHSAGIATLIEFTHRASTGLDVPLIAILIYWAFRVFPRRHPARLAGALSGMFLVTEALIGAFLVKGQHVARNADIYSLSTHLVNTLTLLACLTLTAWWASGKPLVRVRGKAAWLAAISLLAVMLLGITGAIAALGDTLFPAATLAAGMAHDFDPAASLVLRLRGLHPLLAAAVATWLSVYAVSSLRIARYAALRLVAMVWLQLAAGLVNLLMMAPVAMQLLHLLLADLLWISLVVLCASAPQVKVWSQEPGARSK